MGRAYRDRSAAGSVLADALSRYAGRPDIVVLGLVRGGVPVAAAVAKRLSVPMDVLVVRKLAVPGSPEVAFGALGPGGVRIDNAGTAGLLAPAVAAAVVERAQGELAQRERLYRAGRPPLDLRGRVAILVDDGWATGATARAAAAVARRLGASWVVSAAPVGSVQACAALASDVDELICPLRPVPFRAVSLYYADFHQVTDAEVAALLG